MPSLLTAASATVLVLVLAMTVPLAVVVSLPRLVGRALVGMVGAAVAMPIGLLVVDVFFAHLRGPADWAHLVTGVQIVLVPCLGGMLVALHLVTRRERQQVRQKLEPEVDRIRAEERWKIETVKRMAADDPTLLPILRQLEHRVIRQEEFMREMGIPPADLPPSAKGKPPMGRDPA